MKRVANIQIRRRETISLFLLSLMLFSAAVAAKSAHAGTSQNPLVGAWKLVSLEEVGADGQVHKADCTGIFVFTHDGKASVQVMYRNAQTGSAYAQGGYEASYGIYASTTLPLSRFTSTGPSFER
jgi:hypothetical protein